MAFYLNLIADLQNKLKMESCRKTNGRQIIGDILKQILRKINKNKTQKTLKEMYRLATILLIGSAAALRLHKPDQKKNEILEGDLAQVTAAQSELMNATVSDEYAQVKAAATRKD